MAPLRLPKKRTPRSPRSAASRTTTITGDSHIARLLLMERTILRKDRAAAQKKLVAEQNKVGQAQKRCNNVLEQLADISAKLDQNRAQSTRILDTGIDAFFDCECW